VDPYTARVLEEARKIRVQAEKYVAALRDWVEKGPASRFALRPEQLLDRSGRRSPEAALAAAHFELGQQLHRMDRKAAAVPHFREAHRLQPENWTYKRQAWSLINRNQGPSQEYAGHWLGDVQAIGAENYYPPLQM
jgi:hypothetical protein